ncbi:MAG: ABC transporter permease, partial [Duncaniella sp.]|nr:ABC transporter permease [Duncaniella sp.]
MKRKLLKQIRNEWRTNVWLAIELLIVSVVMWYIIDNLYTTFSIMNEPRGFDTEHCYLINSSELTDQSPDYIPDQTQEQRTADLLTFIDSLEKRPEIECVALGQNAYFYNGSNSG